MAGTVTGGKLAAKTNMERHGRDFYGRIGAIGGRNGSTGCFASPEVGADGLTGKERARVAGAAGGRGRRGYTKPPTEQGWPTSRGATARRELGKGL